MALDNTAALALISQGERGQMRSFANVLRAILGGNLKSLSSVNVAFTPFNMTEMRQAAAMKDPLPDAPNGTALGLADTAGAVVTGSTTNSGATVTATETAAFMAVISRNYVDGGPFKVRARAQLSSLTGHTGTVLATCKLMGDAGLGANLVTTAAQALTAAYADYDFVCTPTTLTAGATVQIVVTLSSTASGASNAFPSISAVGIAPSVGA